MQDQIVRECPVYFPSLERALKLVPPEFAEGWQWFMQHEGEHIPSLPHRMKNPPQTRIPLSRDSGIYIPGKSRVKFKDAEHRYALSVHSSEGRGIYSDRPAIDLGDGTWVLDYAAHRTTWGDAKGQAYNDSLMNCLRDAVPVGVMMPDGRSGYEVLGLAYVERFNSATQMFSLHGPVNLQTNKLRKYDALEFNRSEYAKKLREEAAPEQPGTSAIEEDLRKHALIEGVIREQQDAFRKELLAAYGGRCAMTDADVPEALQAAHINPYRGAQTQYINNGLLLRADMHLLFDARLLAIDPDDDRLRLSTRLAGTQYEKFNRRRVRKPDDPKLWPDEDLLGVNFDEFRRANEVLVAT